MTLYLRDDLVAYVIDRRGRGLPMAPSDQFFGTARGRRRVPDRFRDRILYRAAERARENRARRGLPPLPEITPDSLRRTWATFAASVGRDPKWIASANRAHGPGVHLLGLPAGRYSAVHR
jgi:integrase